MLFEMEGVAPDIGRQALRLAAHKLSIATQVRERGGAHAS
jgi:ribosomal protein L16/L10AE